MTDKRKMARNWRSTSANKYKTKKLQVEAYRPNALYDGDGDSRGRSTYERARTHEKQLKRNHFYVSKQERTPAFASDGGDDGGGGGAQIKFKVVRPPPSSSSSSSSGWCRGATCAIAQRLTQTNGGACGLRKASTPCSGCDDDSKPSTRVRMNASANNARSPFKLRRAAARVGGRCAAR